MKKGTWKAEVRRRNEGLSWRKKIIKRKKKKRRTKEMRKRGCKETKNGKNGMMRVKGFACIHLLFNILRHYRRKNLISVSRNR